MNEEQSKKKLLYLDGIRELAAFAVVISHYIQVFYPAALNGKPQQSHFKWDIWYGHSPINLFFNGQFAVFLHDIFSKPQRLFCVFTFLIQCSKQSL